MRRFPLSAVLLAAALLPATPAAAQPRIVGGQDVPEDTFGYVANIAISGAFGCTGTLVAPTWVITAGHCASVTGGAGIASPMTFPPQSFMVTLGTVAADGTDGEQHTVKSVRLNPNYTASNGTGSDVSLLELAAPSAQAPVKIAAPGERSIWEPGDNMIIAGFGVTTEGGDPPDTLQAAQVPIVSDDTCAAAYSDTTPVAGNAFDRMTAVCAGLPQGGRDTCQGDSGGPMLAPVGAGASAVRLVGATSYGEGCAREGKPGVYARLAEGSVKAFIQGIVPDAYASATPAPSPGSTPAPAASPAPGASAAATCAGKPGLTIRIRGRKLRRARVIVAGKTVVNRRGRHLKRFTVRLAKRLPRVGKVTVKVITLTAGHPRRTRILRFADCDRLP